MGSKFTAAMNYLAAAAIVIALGVLPVALICLIWGAPPLDVAMTSGKVFVCCVIVVLYVRTLEGLGLKGA